MRRRKWWLLGERIFLYVISAPLAVAVLLWWFLRGPAAPRKPNAEPAPPAAINAVAQIEAVRSSISEVKDSLQVIVVWEPPPFRRLGTADLVRVEVVPETGLPDQNRFIVLTTQHGDQRTDTINLPVPVPGQSLIGYSCAGLYRAGEPLYQSCTPWQYVRPAAAFDSTADRKTGIVIQPSGLQVDPDIGGSCARWQRSHANRSPWILVNRTAIPECTGPNLRPTVAKFCAFAVTGGRRVKTASSSNDRYCDELFVEWARERYS